MVSDRRRRRLFTAGAAALGLGAGLLGWKLRRDAAAPVPDVRLSPHTLTRLPGPPDAFEIVDAAAPFTVTARAVEREWLQGNRTSMLAYEVEQSGRSTYNPILRIRRGAVIHANFWNQLQETSIIHWHGLRVDANNDGNPHYAVPPGAIYQYRIPIRNRAGTCWYHPHPHALTAGQVYRGLASFLIVEDEEDDALARALDLKLGITDLPLMLQDRHFDVQGNVLRTTDLASHFLGHLGSVPLVNGRPATRLDVLPRIYRLRLLNASGSRVLRLAFIRDDTPQPFLVIGTDGGLLERPLAARESFLAPGERLDVLLDTRAYAAGSSITLRSLAFDAMREPLAQLCTTTPKRADSMEHPMPAGTATNPAIPVPPALADGMPFDLMLLTIHAGPHYERSVPARLSQPPTLVHHGAKIRRFELDHVDMQWRINGVRFDMVKTQLAVERDTTEIWEMHNPPGGMPHPIHFHGFPFLLLARAGSPEQVRRLATDARGLAAAESGWKDTVLVWPGERVRLAVDFTHDYPGEQVYMLHCHNLEHEDQGMMLNVRIVPPGSSRI